MRYLIFFSYDGTKFHGFQRQNDVKNVQGTLEKVLSNYFDESIQIKGSGRTDAGVHAICQCAHFDVDKKISKKDIKRINDELNEEIVIKKNKRVSDDFHARHLVRKKTYIYKVNVGSYDKSQKGYAYYYKHDLDYTKMKDACLILEGTHDFRNFVSGLRDDYVSTIFKIRFKKKKNLLTFTFAGVGFYRYMVRHLVGAILFVGSNKMSLDELKMLLDGRSNKRNSIVVPAEGLYLKKVEY